MSAQSIPAIDDVWRWLAAIPDPEVPAISIVDLGIVRDVREERDSSGPVIVVTITPTYSGCPAMAMIAHDIVATLRGRGVANVRLETRLSPLWTTDWMSIKGKEQLRRYGIAPPAGASTTVITLQRSAVAEASIQCPHCGSANTERVSEFGSTSCKAQHRCRDCLEPFDYFKPI
jgi:ring-1,2-phenylacetyl-CoA epoxidase subunit PaaD